MDPLSILSLVGACVTLASKSLSGLQDIKDFYSRNSKAPESLEYLISDVESAKLFLGMFTQLLTNNHSLIQGLRNVVERKVEVYKSVLQRVQNFAEVHEKKAAEAKSEPLRLPWARLHFTLDEAEIISIRNELSTQMKHLEYMKTLLDGSGFTLEKQHQLQELLEQDLSGGRPSAPAGRLATPAGRNDTASDNRTSRPVAASERNERGTLRRHDKKMSRQLQDASKANNLQSMRDCIARYADVDYQSKKNPPERGGMAAIHLAVINGHYAALEILIDHGANLNAVEPFEHNTALHIAAAKGYSAIVQVLIQRGARIEAKNSQGLTPLLTAKLEAIQLILLKAGANPNTRGRNAQTILHFAAAELGFEDVVRLSIANKAEVDARNEFEQTPLCLVCASTSISEDKGVVVAQILLESGASPRAKSKVAERTPFDNALRTNRSQLVRLLLEHGADPLSRPPGELYPLHRAARDGQIRILNELILHYESINIRDPRTNTTALHVAIVADQEDCTKLLLDKNAKLNLVDSDGLAPVHLVFDRSHTAICEAVLKEHSLRGVSIYQLDTQRGRPAIYWAKTAEAVAIWVRYQGVLDGSGEDGIPPLHHAVVHHNASVVDALIRHGASCGILNKAGHNAIEALCAEETQWATAFNERLAILQLLIKHVPFTEKCRSIIDRWKDKQLQAKAYEQLPWRSVAEIADIAASYATPLILGAAVLGFLGPRRR